MVVPGKSQMARLAAEPGARYLSHVNACRLRGGRPSEGPARGNGRPAEPASADDRPPAVEQHHRHRTWLHPVQAARDKQVPEPTIRTQFEDAVLPHLHAAYNLARWLTRNDQDAEDVVQEAYLRAWKFFGTFHGGASRPWLLTIVRRTCYTWLQHNHAHEGVTEFDDERHSVASEEANPETLLLHRVDAQELRHALEALPIEFREVIILRELEDCSYKEIAAITGVPLGTVMSRLARARQRLQHWLVSKAQGGLP
jgi:RNA polymerase sigma-70 factor (ECF subfamily)